MSTLEISTIVAAVVKAMEEKAKTSTPAVARKVSKGTKRKAKATKVTKAVKAPRQPKAEKTYDKPFEVKVFWTKTGGLIHHGGANVFYRPEGTEEEQIAWLKANGMDSALYVGLVKSEAHKSVWLTYSQSKAAR